ncbi:MAG TPA: NAD(P)-binding domain-containing protein, partial [Candidatus Polarisedimenticolia bacterium]|nr:NAD(P)-binding domain-containing protein [Candidatus Polarisedimenticolia bacterium]
MKSGRERTRIAVIGAGKIGECLIGGLVKGAGLDPLRITATARHGARLEAVAARFGVRTTLSNREAARGARLVLLAVKPQAMEEVLRDLRPV